MKKKRSYYPTIEQQAKHYLAIKKYWADPENHKKARERWTPERREAARQRMINTLGTRKWKEGTTGVRAKVRRSLGAKIRWAKPGAREEQAERIRAALARKAAGVPPVRHPHQIAADWLRNGVHLERSLCPVPIDSLS